jgi:DNA processing protein
MTRLTEETRYQIALTMTPGVGDTAAKNLLSYCGSAEAVFKTPKTKLKNIPGIGEKTAETIWKKDFFDRVEEELLFIDKYKIEVLFCTDHAFPKRLKECVDSPVLLYYRGNADLNQTKILGVVGTRNATDYGKVFIKKMMTDLADQNILILSGLAYGIDTIAHKKALENGLQTVGVLGHGLNHLYPAQNKTLAKQMLAHGGLLTELSSTSQMLPSNFPQRNRIVAGMCDALLVVESATKGGALITANIANSYNKDVFALPGNVYDKYSQGCNFLLKTHKAYIVENAEDILVSMNWSNEIIKPKAQKQLLLNFNAKEKKIVDILKEHPQLEIDVLMKLLKSNHSEYSATLLELEMNGVIVSLPGKSYKLS